MNHGKNVRPLRCQLLTVPGQFAFADRRYRLLRGIDAVVMVCESTPNGIRAAMARSIIGCRSPSGDLSSGEPARDQPERIIKPGQQPGRLNIV